MTMQKADNLSIIPWLKPFVFDSFSDERLMLKALTSNLLL